MGETRVLEQRYRAREARGWLRRAVEPPVPFVMNPGEPRDFPLGKWNDFVVQAKWSDNQDGFVNIWWNGKQIVEYRGPVGYELTTGPEFKFGLYHSDSDQTLVAYYNQVKSGDTPQAVGFAPSTAAPR